MKKYYVIAKRWSEKDFAIIDYIAGEFNDYMNAVLFRDTYNKYYSTDAIIKEVDLLK